MFAIGYGSKLASLEKYQATDLDLQRTFKINSQLSSRSFGELGVTFGPKMQTCKQVYLRPPWCHETAAKHKTMTENDYYFDTYTTMFQKSVLQTVKMITGSLSVDVMTRPGQYLLLCFII